MKTVYQIFHVASFVGTHIFSSRLESLRETRSIFPPSSLFQPRFDGFFGIVAVLVISTSYHVELEACESSC